MSKFGVGKWKVTTIDCGWHIGNKVNLTPGRDDHPVKLPYLAFLLQDGEKNILIDNGINERFLINGCAWGCWEKSSSRTMTTIQQSVCPASLWH